MNDLSQSQGRDVARVSTVPASWPGFPIAAPAPAQAAAPADPPAPTANEAALESIKNKITGLPAEVISIYNAYRALELLRAPVAEAAQKSIIWQATHHVDRLHPRATADKISYEMVRGFGTELTALAALEAGIRTLEANPALADAIAQIDPLHVERERLEAAVAADNQARAQAHQDVIDAQAKAIKKAQLAVESDSDVAAARARLASFDAPAPSAPAPLIRGKVKLAADPLAGDLH